MRLKHKVILTISLASIPVAFSLVMLAIYTCICGTCFCSDEHGFFTLVIKGTPSAAKVFVNEIEFPVPQENGEIKLPYMKSNIIHEVRVSHERYGDFVFTAMGEAGEIKEFTVQLRPVQDIP